MYEKENGSLNSSIQIYKNLLKYFKDSNIELRLIEGVENYYTNGDVVTMTANNKVRLWLSNGNTVKFQVIAATQTYELEIAKAGECVVEDIKWIRTDDGKYRLVVEPID